MHQRHDVETHFVVEIFPPSPLEYCEAFSWFAKASRILSHVPTELVLVVLIEVTPLFGGPLRDSELGPEAHGVSFT